MDPDQNERAVHEALDGAGVWNVRWVAETGSTNADLLAAARQGAPGGEVLVADHQTAGRGRLGRSWTAPPGASLLVSMLVRPALAPQDGHLAAFAAALSAADGCLEVAGVTPGLKWPNDLVMDGPGGTRKLAGVLSESVIEAGDLAAVVVGVGINVNWPEDLPQDLAETATALSHLAGRPVDRSALLSVMLLRLGERMVLLNSGEGRRAVLEEARRRCVTLGRQVRVETGGHDIAGVATDLVDGGHLVVETAGGDIETIAVGDVVHLR